MFGTLRIALALFVVLYHLAHVPLLGQYAVFSFFTLSGFLMTAIMQGSYGYSPRGIVRYLTNRILRLFPNYFYALAVSCAVIALFGAARTTALNPALFMPASAGAWTANLLMTFPAIVPATVVPRLVPPAWALTIEWLYYLLIGFGLSRSRGPAAAWLIVSLLATVALYAVEPTSGLLYGSIWAGSLPFAAGSLAFHEQARLLALLRRWRIGLPLLFAAQFASFAFPFVAKRVLHFYVDPIGNWLNVLASCLIIVALNDLRSRATPRHRRLDARLGDFSYPFYLLHFPVGVIGSWLALGAHPATSLSLRSLAATAVTLPLLVIASLAPVFVIDPLVQRRRDRIRQSAPGAQLEGF